MVRVAARRDGPGHVYCHIAGDRAGQGAAEDPVAGCEPGHPVTDLADDPGIVGSEPARQGQATRNITLVADAITAANG
jgi:hypothetical protein